MLANAGQGGVVERGGGNIVESDDGTVGWDPQACTNESSDTAEGSQVVEGYNSRKWTF